MLLTCSAGISSGSACWRWCSSISSCSSATTIDRSFLMNIELRRISNPPMIELGTISSSTDGLGADGVDEEGGERAHRRWRR